MEAVKIPVMIPAILRTLERRIRTLEQVRP
jgi:hypothetical protein